jgi:hypothetical protein
MQKMAAEEAAKKTNVYCYDSQARYAMCAALARALRVRYAVMDYERVYETRLCPHPDEEFTSLDDARDALVRALRAYEAEAEACERALQARSRAELQRQQTAAVNAEARRPLPLASGVSKRRQTAMMRRASSFF